MAGRFWIGLLGNQGTMNADDRCFCELAPLYALGLLDDVDRRWVDDQVAANPELAAELAEYQTAVSAIPYSAPPLPVPADLKARLWQRLESTSAINPSVGTDSPVIPSPLTPLRSPRDSQARTPGRGRQRLWLRAGGAIAAVVAIALVVDKYRLRQTIQDDRAVMTAFQQPDRQVYTLQGTDQAVTAAGSLVVDPAHKAAVVLVKGLPELPTGQAYRLWAVAKGATKPTYCGQFKSHHMGTTARWQLADAACSTNVAQMLITADATTAPPVPAGPLFMKSVL